MAKHLGGSYTDFQQDYSQHFQPQSAVYNDV